MTARDLTYWLQGFFEIGGVRALTKEEAQVIQNHLNLVFIHDIDTPDPTGKLQAAHDGKSSKITDLKIPRPTFRPDQRIRC